MHQKPAALACSPRLRVSSPSRCRPPLPPDPHPRPPKPTPRQGFAIGATEAYVSNAAFALENLPRTLAINHSTDACGANRKTLQGYFDSVYPLASVPAKKCLEGKSPANDLWFFYDNAPEYLIERVGGQPQDMPKSPRLDPSLPDPNFDFNPPKLWEPYTVFGNDNCTFYINRYPPKAWWEFDAAAGVPSGSAVEVVHVKVSSRERGGSFNLSAPFNQSLYNGFFWYYAPGAMAGWAWGWVVGAGQREGCGRGAGGTALPAPRPPPGLHPAAWRRVWGLGRARGANSRCALRPVRPSCSRTRCGRVLRRG